MQCNEELLRIGDFRWIRSETVKLANCRNLERRYAAAMIRIMFAALMALLALPTASRAQAPRIDGALISEYGIYVVYPEQEAAPNAGLLNSEFELREATRVIPARLGLRFGLLFSVTGEPAGTRVPVRLVVVYPPGVDNPETTVVDTQIARDIDIEIGRARLMSVTFDKAWGLAPGEWIFQIWSHDVQLAEQSFTVIKPEPWRKIDGIG